MASRIESLARSAAISAVLLFLASSPASAQTAPPAAAPAPTAAQSAFLGATFAQAVHGREVWITTSDGSRLKARVVAVAPTGLTVTGTSGQGRTLRFEEIARLQKVSHRLRTHTIVGLSVGTGIGLLGAIACEGEGDGGCGAAVLLSYAGIGLGIGALNGAIRNAVNRDNDLIYDAGLRTTTLAIAPMLSPTRKGVAFTMTWR